MTRLLTILSLIFGIGLTPALAADDPAKGSPLRLMLTESAPGSMSTEQYCLLVFSDRSFHAERANRKQGKDRDRKVFEGQVSEADWNALAAIVDTKEFREMKVSHAAPPPVIENSHPYTISVIREKGYQNVEFLTSDSMKPYEHQVKPLLQWWKSLRGSRMSESKGSPDARCSPDSDKSIFSY